jgi:hypothetical protein
MNSSTRLLLFILNGLKEGEREGRPKVESEMIGKPPTPEPFAPQSTAPTGRSRRSLSAMAPIDRLYTAAVEKHRQVLAEDKATTDAIIRKLTVISPAALKFRNPKATELLYYYPRQLKEQHMESLRQRYDPQKEYREYVKKSQLREQITADEVTEMGKRLCFTSQERKRNEVLELTSQLYPPPAGRKLKADEQRACAERLSQPVAASQQLEDKYLWKPDHSVKRTAEELMATAARLFAGGK